MLNGLGMKKIGLCFLHFLVFAMLILGLATARAQNIYYVRPGASGANNGSDWNNAFSSLPNPAALVRGATYYLAAGNYGAPNFTTPDSGTNTITILAATVASHGTNTGWNNAYAPSGTNVVLFTADVGINSDNWIFSGQSRGGWTNGYNMKFLNATDGNGGCVDIGDAETIYSGLSFSYCEFEGTHGVYGEADMAINLYGYSRINNFYFGYNWAHDVGGDFISMNSEIDGDGAGTNYLFEFDYFYQNHETGNWNLHDQCFQITATDLIIRYCYLQDMSSSGFITDASANQTAAEGNWQIYGNVFFWDSWYESQTSLSGIGNGIVAFYGETWSGPFYFCNNTIAGITNDAGGLAASGFTGLPVAKMSPVYIVNNVWWYCDPNSIGDMGPWQGMVGAFDYNSYYQMGGVQDGGVHSTASKSNPFVNSSLNNFLLTSDTTAGTNLPAPYNKDMNGILRGADGVWDRGAFQISGAPNTNPPVISAVQATTNSLTTATITWTTDQQSSSAVKYGLTTAYGNVVSNASLVTSHSLSLTNLTPGTTYHYVVESANSANILATSSDTTFTTLAVDTNPPVISGVQASPTGPTSANVTWTTDEQASSLVQYGLTASYGSTISNGTLVTSHSVALANLTPSTTYHYSVQSANDANISSSSADSTFTTPAPSTNPPVVTVTSPTARMPISGTTTLSAAASGNEGVTRVQFLVDGQAVGSPTAAAPYSVTWNSTTVNNGYHSIQAAASDTSGNTSTSTDVSVNVQNHVTNGLVGYWTFDEGAGIQAGDSSGNGGVATLTNGASWTPGVIGPFALLLDGTNASATVPNSAALQIPDSLTITLWIKHTALPTVANEYMYYLEKGYNIYEDFGFGAYTDSTGASRLFFEFIDPNGDWYLLKQGANQTLTTGLWTHVAVVFDNSTALVSFYVNGTLAANLAAPSTLGPTTYALLIGQQNSPGYSPDVLAGSIDDLRIYNRALSAAEVSSTSVAPAEPTILRVIASGP